MYHVQVLSVLLLLSLTISRCIAAPQVPGGGFGIPTDQLGAQISGLVAELQTGVIQAVANNIRETLSNLNLPAGAVGPVQQFPQGGFPQQPQGWFPQNQQFSQRPQQPQRPQQRPQRPPIITGSQQQQQRPPPPPIPVPKPSTAQSCGRHDYVRQRIVGGQPADKDEWPWMAALFIGQKFCGGAIINDFYILTAAHCVQGFGTNDIGVIIGQYDLEKFNGQPSPISKVVVHENFVRKTFTHDIALLRMQNRMTFTKSIRPICLPPKGDNLEGKSVTVVGYGSTGGGKSSSQLLEVTMPVTRQDDCKKSFGTFPITDLQLCAGFPAGGKDACQGDSGGPLMYEKFLGQWEVVGVVSFGKGCGEPNKPGVYTRIDQYIDWIKRNAV